MKEENKNMEYSNYLINSERTFSYFDMSMIPDNHFMDMFHCAVGLYTETDEFINPEVDDENLLEQNIFEELGDVMWYSANLFRLINEKYGTSFIRTIDVKLANKTLTIGEMNKILLRKTNKILDVFKKCLFYRRPVEDYIDKLYNYNADIHTLLSTFYCQYYGFNFDKVMEKNIEKLRVRYPEKFDSFKSVNRDIDKEYSVGFNND